jgi:hypothetical protein
MCVCSNTVHTLTTENTQFAQFLAQQRERMDGMDLMSLLIAPVQRIPRYALLLREVLKYTPAHHEDHAGLQEALLKIEAVAARVNESKRHCERVEHILNIMTRLGRDCPPLFAPTRTLVQEIELTVRSASRFGEPTDKPRVFFLFNDMLVWAHSTMEFRGCAALVDVVITDLPDHSDSSFGLQHPRGVLHVVCPSPQVKAAFLALLLDNVSQSMETRSEVPSRKGVRACMHACMYACMYVCMYVCMHV